MDSTVNLSVTPLQALFALAFYVWQIVFPIILIQKINRLERIIDERLGSVESVGEDTENV